MPNADPVDLIDGLNSDADVSKPETRAELKKAARQFTSDEVANTSLAGRFVIIVNGFICVKDTESAEAPDGVTTYRDGDGIIWRRVGTGVIERRVVVRTATTANITIATALNNGDSLDGLTLATGNLVLVKDQTNKIQNGIYVVGTTPIRLASFDEWGDFIGLAVMVAEGTANGNKLFLSDATAGGTIGTTELKFVQMNFSVQLNSPDFTGTPTAPTASPGTNTTQIATTAFVKAAIDAIKDGVSSAFDTLSEIATALGLKAPIASPTFTGTPAAPTASADTNTTQIATTAFVVGQAGTATPLVAASTAAVGTSLKYARQDHVHPTDTSRAALTDVYAAAAQQRAARKGWPSLGGINIMAVPGVAAPASVTFTRSGSAWDWSPNGSVIEYASNKLRQAHDGETGEWLGWRLSPQSRTEYVRNNTMAGAAAGTPGTAPNLWGAFQAFLVGGISREIIGVVTRRNVPCLRVRVFGTGTTANGSFVISFNDLTHNAAAKDEVWSGMALLSLVSGSLSGLTSAPTLNISERDSGGTQISTQTITTMSSLDAKLRKFGGGDGQAKTLGNASTAFVTHNVVFPLSNGVAYDFTIDVGLPSLRKASYIDTPILTSVAAVTVPAETLSAAIPDEAWSDDAMTLMWRGRVSNIATLGADNNTAVLLAVDDASINNRMQIAPTLSTGLVGQLMVSGAAVQASISVSGSVTNGQEFAAAAAAKVSSAAVSRDGIAPVTAAPTAMPVGMAHKLNVGKLGGGQRPCAEHTVKQFSYFPVAAAVQALSLQGD